MFDGGRIGGAELRLGGIVWFIGPFGGRVVFGRDLELDAAFIDCELSDWSSMLVVLMFVLSVVGLLIDFGLERGLPGEDILSRSSKSSSSSLILLKLYFYCKLSFCFSSLSTVLYFYCFF